MRQRAGRCKSILYATWLRLCSVSSINSMMFGISPKIVQSLSETGRLQSLKVPNKQTELKMIGPVPLPMELNGRRCCEWYVAAADENGFEGEHLSVMMFGDVRVSSTVPPLVRVHSTCFTGDVLGSRRCDCGPQLAAAVRRMDSHESGGLLIYLAAHEGRGIGLWAKAAAYLLQDEGADTYEANRSLGFRDDDRDYSEAAAIIQHFLGDRAFRLLTNNPNKVSQLRAAGIPGVQRDPHVAGVCERNLRYLEAKRGHGHTFSDDALSLAK